MTKLLRCHHNFATVAHLVVAVAFFVSSCRPSPSSNSDSGRSGSHVPSAVEETSKAKLADPISGKVAADRAGLTMDDIAAQLLLPSCGKRDAFLYQLPLIESKRKTVINNAHLVATTTLNDEGLFRFTEGDADKLLVPGDPVLIVAAPTCTNLLMRVSTGSVEQNLDSGSTFVASALLTSDLAAVASPENSAKAQMMANGLQPATTVRGAFELAGAGPAFSDAFAAISSVSSVQSMEAHSSVMVASILPTEGEELEEMTFTILVGQPSGAALSYEWRLDTQPVGNAATYSFTPGADDPGQHSLDLRVTSAHSEYSQQLSLHIENTVAASPPKMHVKDVRTDLKAPVGVVARSVPVVLETGDALANCQGIAKLALSENVATTPAADQFTIVCKDPGTQELAVNLATSGSGLKTLRLWAIDSRGNISTTPSELPLYLFLTKPYATSLNIPSDESKTVSLSATVISADSAEPIKEYRFKVGKTGSIQCDQEKDYSPAATSSAPLVADLSAAPDGAMRLCMISNFAPDPLQGLWQPVNKATQFDWTKDTTPPVATIAGQPVGTSSAVAVRIAVAGADVKTYRYKLGPAQTTDCGLTLGYSFAQAVSVELGASLNSVADGVMRLCVLGIDAATNQQESANATTATWTKDTLPPVAAFANAPPDPSNQTTLSVSVGGEQVQVYRYKFGAAANTSCGDATGYSVDRNLTDVITDSLAALADGSYRICAVGRDSAMNWQAFPSASAWTWTKDTVPPHALLSNLPSDPSNVVVPGIAVGGDRVSHFRVKIGVAGSTDCTVGTGYGTETIASGGVTTNIASVADGPVKVCVVGRSLAGTWQDFSDASPATWTKDTIPPVATMSGLPADPSNAQLLGIDVGGTDVVQYKYKVGQASAVDCSNATGYGAATPDTNDITASISAIPDGVVKICVVGRDPAGNWQSNASATTAQWTKDTDPPAAIFSGLPAEPSNVTTLGVTVGGTGVAKYKYKLGVAAATDCTNAASYSADINANVAISDTLGAVPDGIVTLCAVGVDAVGNWQLFASATTFSWTKDTVAPTAILAGTPADPSLVTTLAVTVSGSQVTLYAVKLGVAASTDCSVAGGYGSPINNATTIQDSIVAIADGSVKLCVIGGDAAGNWQSKAAATSVTWVKDTVAPTATLTGTPADPSNVTILAVDVGGAGVVTYMYKVGAASSTNCSSSSGYGSSQVEAQNVTNDISGLSDVAIRLCVVGVDAAGNVQPYSGASVATWTKDTIPPAATLSVYPTGYSSASSLGVHVAGTDVVSYKFKVGVQSSTDCAASSGYGSSTSQATNITADLTGIADGPTRLCVIGADAVGNWQTYATATTVTWTKDVTAPTVAVVSLAANAATTSDPYVALDISASDAVGIEFMRATETNDSCADDNWVAWNTGSEFVLSNLAGAKTVYVCVKDFAGNRSAVVSDGITYSPTLLTAPYWKQIATGRRQVCGLTVQGTVYCWGKDATTLALGNGTGQTTDQAAPQYAVDTSGLTGNKSFLQISVGAGGSDGSETACGVAGDGRLYCWGQDSTYELLGDSAGGTNQAKPVAVSTTNMTGETSVIQVTVGHQHACLLTAQGRAYCWGGASFHQLGNGSSTATQSAPVPVDMANVTSGRFIRIAAGYSHSCAVSADAKTYCWGTNDSGQLGTGGATNQNVPVAVSTSGIASGSKSFVDVIAGHGFSCGLMADGKIYCWGSDANGSLGNGSDGCASDTLRPRSASGCALDTAGISSEKAFIKIAGGYDNVCGVTGEGVAYCWGPDGSQQLGNGLLDTAIHESPTAVATTVISGEKTITDVTIGVDVMCVVTIGGVAYCYGSESYGEIGNGGTTTDALGQYSGVALNVSSVAGSAFGFRDVVAQRSSSCGVGATGTVYCWGADASYQLGNNSRFTVNQTAPSPLRSASLSSGDQGVRAIGGAWDTSCALSGKGKPWCWGKEDSDQIGDGTNAYDRRAPVAVDLSGVTSAKAMRQIAAGQLFSCALTADGMVWCWGGDDSGQLGNGSNLTATQSTPSPIDSAAISGERLIKQIAVGSSHACALTGDGLVYCWGAAANGRLGTGASSTDQSSPVAVDMAAMSGSTRGVQICAGEAHTCALAADGKAYCWGLDANGRLGNGGAVTSDQTGPSEVDTSNVVGDAAFRQISCGRYHTCGVTSAGSAYCWGSNSGAQLGIGSSTGNYELPTAVDTTGLPAAASWSKLSAGEYSTCGLAGDGVARCWGDDTAGRLGNGTVTGTQASPSAVDASAL